MIPNVLFSFKIYVMKKKIILGLFILTCILLINDVVKSGNAFNDKALKNIEALVQIKTSQVSGKCKGSTDTRCYYDCCICGAKYESQSSGETLESLSGICEVCGTPVEDCLQ